jgi:hypothetical protein
LLVLTTLAGCADAPMEPEEESLGVDESLTATADTGVIRGVVVDASIVPVPGVTIALEGTEQTTETGEDGAFGFSNVEPGVYFLQASKIGWVTTQTSTSVVAGVEKPPAVRVQMVPDPENTPYYLSFNFKGHMGCSLSYIALCGLPVVDEATNDKFLAQFPVDAPPQFATIEAIWKGTQPTGNQMNLNFGGTPAGPGTTFNTSQGPSPLYSSGNETQLAEMNIGSGEDLIGRMFAWEAEGTGIDDHTGQCVPVVLTTYCQGPGVALQQDFEFFVHTFYLFEPSEEWRFSVDGDPIPPS